MKMKSIKCPGCEGPSFVDTEKGTIVFCPYCGTRIVLDALSFENDHASRKPDGGEKEAEERKE